MKKLHILFLCYFVVGIQILFFNLNTLRRYIAIRMNIQQDVANFNVSIPYKKGNIIIKECGQENPTHKMINGKKSTISQYPWIVLIFLKKGRCTGSIISANFILTAAHCVMRSDTFIILAGIDDLINKYQPHVQKRETTIKYPHPQAILTDENCQNDIAILKVENPFILNKYVSPVCLPTYSDVNRDYTGKLVTTAGWGKNQDNVYTKMIHYGRNIVVMNNTDCKISFLTKSHLCTFSYRGRGPCSGDSGGPLNYEITPTNNVILGVTSFIYTSDCKGSHPQIFSRITEYLPWIETITGLQILP